MNLRAKRLSGGHSLRGQNRYGELITLFKAYPPQDRALALEAIAVAAGQFASSNTEHYQLCKVAADACLDGKMTGWTGRAIQTIVNNRHFAQMRCGVRKGGGWDVRTKWAGWRYQYNFGITGNQAIELHLTDIVRPDVSRKVKRHHKTPQQWRKQTQAASDKRSAQADRNALVAIEMRSQGVGIATISKRLGRSARTVYNYFKRGLWLVLQFRSDKRSDSKPLNDIQSIVSTKAPTQTNLIDILNQFHRERLFESDILVDKEGSKILNNGARRYE